MFRFWCSLEIDMSKHGGMEVSSRIQIDGFLFSLFHEGVIYEVRHQSTDNRGAT